MQPKGTFIIGIVIAIIALAVVGAAIHYSRSPRTGDQLSVVNTSKNPTKPNMNNTAELKIEDVKVGTGPAAKAGDLVTVNYTGTFADGTKFDSSFDRNQPFSFVLGAGNVIQGWDQGVAGMQVGGTRKLVIPPALGYGANDYAGIPGNSTLYFTVDLLKIGS